jgi:plastocyanin
MIGMSRRYLAISIGVLALVASACGDDGGDVEGGDGGGGRPVEVTAADFSFDPASIAAEAGESIELTLTNSGDAEHSFTIDDVVEVEAEGGEEASGSFTAPDETVEFYCEYHPDQMRGELTIGG